MAFIDDVLNRRFSFVRLEDDAIASIQAELSRIKTTALNKLKELKDYEDKDGSLIDNADVRRYTEATLREVERASESAVLKASTMLHAAKERAFEQGLADLHYAIDNMPDSEVQMDDSLSQIYLEAARESASRPVLGSKYDKQLKKIPPYLKRQVKSALTNGILSGDSADNVGRRIAEAVGITERAGARIARTNINASMNDAHMAFYQEHEDLFKGYRWDSVMDGHTSTICATLHGRFFRMDETPPGPPAHPNCRSVLVGVFKDDDVEEFAQGGMKRVRDIDEGDPANKTRLINNDTDFEDWLKKQKPSASQNITKSEIKDKLWRQKKIEFSELVAPDLSVRSDEEIVRRALTQSPDDTELQSLAQELKVKKTTKKKLVQEDKALANQQNFDLGEPRE